MLLPSNSARLLVCMSQYMYAEQSPVALFSTGMCMSMAAIIISSYMFRRNQNIGIVWIGVGVQVNSLQCEPFNFIQAAIIVL